MRHLKCDVCPSFWLDQTCHVRPRRLDVVVCANIRYLHSCIMIWINEVFLRERLKLFCLSTHTYGPSDVPCVPIYNEMNCGKWYCYLFSLLIKLFLLEFKWLVHRPYFYCTNSHRIVLKRQEAWGRPSVFIHSASYTASNSLCYVWLSEIISHLWWNPDVHHCVHKNPPKFPIPTSMKFQL
jgi:hypothetical protein